LNSHIKENNLTTDILLEIPIIIKNSPIFKRKEEQLKFVFNWGFKYLKTRYFETISVTEGSVDSDKLFYEYYFGHLAKEKHMDLIKFYKPNFNSTIDESERSFNNNFIRQLRQSPKFIQDFVNVIDFDIYDDYSRTVEVKLHAFISKWEIKYQQSTSKEDTTREICNYINKSKKFKFPWSFKEIADSIELVKTCLNVGRAKKQSNLRINND